MDVLFNSYKVKYVLLDEWSGYLFETRPSSVNVFINLEPIIIDFCNPRINEKLTISMESAVLRFISNIMGVAVHYRHYFIKNRVPAKVFMYLQYPALETYKNRNYNKEYRMMYNSKINKSFANFNVRILLEQAIKLTQLILEYIDGVYLITSGNVENSLVPKIIMEERPNTGTNFIVSRSSYDFQYVNHSGTIILPKLSNSKMLNGTNLLNHIQEINHIQYQNIQNSKLYAIILSLLGNKIRNIYGIKGIGPSKTFKTIQEALDNGIISDTVENIDSFISVIKREYKGQILSNFYCTDINHQMFQLNKKDIINIMSQIKDKYDNESLKSINDKYFLEYPLPIIELTEQISAQRKTLQF